MRRWTRIGVSNPAGPFTRLRIFPVAVIAFLSAGALLAAAASSFGHETGFHHAGWSGLGAVFDLKQSSDGYLWLTTSKGVLRFDGVRFESIEQVTRGAVHVNEIDSVFLSSSGGLWLTTEGAGLLLWKDGRLTAFPDRRCTPVRKQGKIVEDRDGALWVQATAGLFRLRGSVCQEIGAEQGYPGGFPAGVFMDSGGSLWVKTRTGPLLYLPRGASKFRNSGAAEGISTGFAYLHESPGGGIWLSDDQGLREVEHVLGASNPSPLQPYRGRSQFGDFSFSADGSLWAVTGNGVRHFEDLERWREPVAAESAPGQNFTPEQGLTSDAAWRILIDRDGVWVATNAGLDCLRRAALTMVRLPHAQEHEYSVAAGDNGSVWTGNSSLPLTHVAADGKITTFPHTRQTVSVWRDHNGAIWSGSAGGQVHLWRVSGEKLLPLHYPGEDLDSVVFAATDRSNDPWITTVSGRAYHLSRGRWTNETQILGKKPGVVGAMADDQAGNLWFAFSNKVIKWDGSVYHRFSFPDGQHGVSENTMSVRGDHVWLGGAGGVQLFRGGRFSLMHWKDGTLPGRVSGLVETEAGDLWINGFSGVTHVPASELKRWLGDPSSAVSGEHLDELDGLPGLSGETFPEPSLVEAPDGRLWFATTQGIAWLDPKTFDKSRNRVPPPVMISAVISNGRTYADSKTVTLPPQAENLEIDYTALSFAIPQRVLFRYRLDDVDEAWQDVGTRRQAYYTKLRPGMYKFHVIACNNDGVWNEAGASVDLRVSPAWFQTLWFRILCVMCGIFLVSAAYRLRLRQVAARINARFDERLAERTRIAQELHDTLLQGFLSASMQVHVAADRLPPDSQAKPILTRALQLMSQVIEEGRNAVRGLRLSNSASLDLEQAFATIQQEFEPQGKAVEFRIITEGQRRALHPLLRDEAYRIGREALTNAFRHAHAHRIDLELKYGSHQFRLLVRDDGRGIEPDILLQGRNGHWGLSVMRERADRIGARLHVFSRASAGTEVELTVPGRVAFQDPPHGLLQRFRKRGQSHAAGSSEHELAGTAHQRR